MTESCSMPGPALGTDGFYFKLATVWGAEQVPRVLPVLGGKGGIEPSPDWFPIPGSVATWLSSHMPGQSGVLASCPWGTPNATLWGRSPYHPCLWKTLGS